MALNLVYPLKKGTYHRVRGFASHVKHNPGTWYGIDDGCIVGTQGYAPDDGITSHWEKRQDAGGWNFRFNLINYRGWFFWFAHNSQIPTNNRTFKRGAKMFRTGATGGVTGPHLHYSLMKGSVPKDPDNTNVVKWTQMPTYLTKAQKKKICVDFLGRGCSAGAYAANLTYEGLIKRAYPEIKLNYKKLNILRKSVTTLQTRVIKLEKAHVAAVKKTAEEFQKKIDKLEVVITTVVDDRNEIRDTRENQKGEIQTLKDALKVCQNAPKEAKEYKKKLYQPMDWNVDWIGQLWNDLIKFWKRIKKGVRKRG